MKEIPLTQGQFAIVDDWWYDYLMQWKWYAQWMENTKSFRACRMEKRKEIKMHRVVAQTPDGMICDHIHHNTLDNREAELRNVTHSQSIMNTKKRSDNISGARGVSRYGKQYVAQLSFQGKVVFFKSFPTFEKAVAARLVAEKEYYGEFMYDE